MNNVETEIFLRSNNNIVFLHQLQDDKKRLQDENDRFASETIDLKKEVDELKVRLEETEWGLCQKSGELAHVKSQLKDTQVSLPTIHEMLWCNIT